MQFRQKLPKRPFSPKTVAHRGEDIDPTILAPEQRRRLVLQFRRNCIARGPTALRASISAYVRPEPNAATPNARGGKTKRVPDEPTSTTSVDSPGDAG